MSLIAHRMSEIASFYVMQIQARARELANQGHRIIHMEIGETDFTTPAPVLTAGMKALEDGHITYTAPLGLAQLRAVIADYYVSWYGLTVPSERVAVTTGASGALLLSLGAMLNPGDEILVLDPCYPCYRNFVRLFGGIPVPIPVDASTRFQLTPKLVQKHWTAKTRGVILASPANPTGTVIKDADLEEIIQFALSKAGNVIIDEIYHGLTYEGPITSALKFSDQIFVINSFSKYFNMTGWRLGWLVAPHAYIKEIEKLAENIFISPSYPAQHAALAAFLPETIEILEQRRAQFKMRRDFLLAALTRLGFTIPAPPEGAFYIYANCKKFSNDSAQFSLELLEKTGVAVTPGFDFGSNRSKEYIRFAYTTSMENLEEGVRQIEKFLSSLRTQQKGEI